MGVNVTGFRRRSRLYHMAERAPTCAHRLRRIIMFRMHTDGFRAGKFSSLYMAGKAEGVIEIGFDQLESASSPMGIMTVKAGDLSLEMNASQEVEPLLVMRLGMGLRVS